MEITCVETFHKRMMPYNVLKNIQWAHREQGPEIMASWLQDMYIKLRFSPKEAKSLVREQGLDSPEAESHH